MSSSLATALQSADAATVRLAKVSRQVATGKEVSSAKDDGARYVQASALKSQQKTSTIVLQTLDLINANLEMTDVALQLGIQQLEKLQELQLSARSHAVGSTARQQIQAEWNQVTQWAVPSQGLENPMFASLTAMQDLGAHNVGIDLSGMDPMLGGGLWAAAKTFGGHVSGGVPVMSGFDLINANTAALDAVAANINAWLGDRRGRWTAALSSDQNRADRLTDHVRSDIDRLDSAIGSLTDADMGKLSTQQQQAQTRQQLALQTIQQALTAYGNYAGGLLGNVQRTQRAIA